MTTGPVQPKINLTNRDDYRESYANSVQMRLSLWDFFILFGTFNQSTADSVTIQNYQGIFMSPPQAKAFYNLLKQNITQYESTFGEIRLEAQASGPVIQ
jgi:hypothetical protein